MNTNHDALREALIDPTDGENRAVRCFLMFYTGGSAMVADVRENMRTAGFPYWPEWVEKENAGALSKLGAQNWLRHLFALEALSQPMPEAAAQGWKLVPVKATLEMMQAASRAYFRGDGWQEIISEAIAASPAAPEVAKPLPTMVDKKSTNPQPQAQDGRCDHHACIYPMCDCQPQAQGEPEVVAHRYEFGNAENDGEPLITLQSHREALAKHRAALEAERNRLDFLAQTQSYIEWNLAGDCCRVVPPNGFSHWFDTPRAAIDAAITHANQVLEGGGK